MSWDPRKMQPQTDPSGRAMACSSEFPSMVRFSTLAVLHIFLAFFWENTPLAPSPRPQTTKKPPQNNNNKQTVTHKITNQSCWSSVRINLNVLDSKWRFTEGIMFLCIATGTSSYKLNIQVVLLKAVCANGTVCVLIMWLSLMIMYEPLNQGL